MQQIYLLLRTRLDDWFCCFFFVLFLELSVKNSNSMDLLDHVREEIVESVDILDILTGLRK